MEKRVVFRSAWLPYALVAPQIAITIVFFFWPAAQAFWYSFQLQDAFGLNTEFVGLRNFQDLFRDSHYLDAFKVTAVFSVLVAGGGIAVSLVLATMADRVVRGALVTDGVRPCGPEYRGRTDHGGYTGRDGERVEFADRDDLHDGR